MKRLTQTLIGIGITAAALLTASAPAHAVINDWGTPPGEEVSTRVQVGWGGVGPKTLTAPPYMTIVAITYSNTNPLESCTFNEVRTSATCGYEDSSWAGGVFYAQFKVDVDAPVGTKQTSPSHPAIELGISPSKPVIDAFVSRNPTVFTGSGGFAGATVMAKDEGMGGGNILGTTTVDSAGNWSLRIASEPATGIVNIYQGVNEIYSPVFVFNRLPVPMVDSIIAGGTALVLLAGVGTFVAVKRRKGALPAA